MGALAVLAGSQAAGGLISSAGQLWGDQMTRNFERAMSNSAHQREVEDLKAAGLNPMLSAMHGSGASTPNVTTGNPGEGIGNAVSNIGRSLALDIPRLTNEKTMTEANSARMAAETRKTDAETLVTLQQAGRGDALTEKLRAEIAATQAGTREASAGALLKEQESGRANLVTGKLQADILATKQGTLTSTAQQHNYEADTAKTKQETAVLEAIVPFITQGAKAIKQVEDFLATGDIGDGLAKVIGHIKEKDQAGADALRAWGRKHWAALKAALTPSAGPGPQLGPDTAEWSGYRTPPLGPDAVGR